MIVCSIRFNGGKCRYFVFKLRSQNSDDEAWRARLFGGLVLIFTDVRVTMYLKPLF